MIYMMWETSKQSSQNTFKLFQIFDSGILSLCNIISPLDETFILFVNALMIILIVCVVIIITVS